MAASWEQKRTAAQSYQNSVLDKRGGLNGSTQHSSRTRLALKTKAKSLARVRSAGTLPWLGFDRGQPNRSLLPKKHCRINALDGVASTGPERAGYDWLSVVVLVYRGFPLLYRAANPKAKDQIL